MKKIGIIFFIFIFGYNSFSKGDLDLLEDADIDVLETNKAGGPASDSLDLSEVEDIDDLDSLRADVGDIVFGDEKKKSALGKSSDPMAPSSSIKLDESPLTKKDAEIDMIIQRNAEIVNDSQENEKRKLQNEVFGAEKVVVFDVGEEEKKLLELSKFVEAKISEKEWDEIAIVAKQDRYIIQEGDWLWKICKKIFGSGFYYAKIWSMNPFITNPHEIEPGMVLIFDTGSSSEMPDAALGSFSNMGSRLDHVMKGTKIRFESFGNNVKPAWIDEREKLIRKGAFFQFASEETYQDLAELGRFSLNNEYEAYEPPLSDIRIAPPDAVYDETGFDQSSVIIFDYNEGFHLNSFVSSNITLDLGYVDSFPDENIFAKGHRSIFVYFDDSVRPRPGDLFSVYMTGGKISHPVSERSGYRYTITGEIKVVKKINHLWECEVTQISSPIQRGDRVTVHSPKLKKIVKTFGQRNIEAAIIGTYEAKTNFVTFGDVVYIDRGRADGVEMGNVFELYGFSDRGTNRRITRDPAYKVGELTVITLTDDFATALISNVLSEIKIGSIGLTKTEEKAALTARLRNSAREVLTKNLEERDLDELDVELNIDDISEDLLDRADSIQLTEDELEELERQEREKSILRDHERDLKELERLEAELIATENALNEAKLDEDRFLEQQNLDLMERKTKGVSENAFAGLDEIEKDLGKKYLDQDINSQENPYGLTEFDLEEIDELLNTESL